MGSSAIGRPRDPDLDGRIIEAAIDLMAEGGLEALTFGAVAERAETTRPAWDRRFGDKTALAVAAISSLAAATRPERTGSLRDDLAAELWSFRAGLTKLNGLGIAGAVLAGTTDPAITATYRDTVVAPRRARIAAIIADGVDAGELTASAADQRVLVSMCTGSWYGYALAGTPPPRDWPDRTARLVWAAATHCDHRPSATGNSDFR
jgi:AcrR family transcriptional regulator